MDAVTYPHPEVRAEREHWIASRIDVAERPSLARAFDVPAVPLCLALDGAGTILGRRPGFVEPAALAAWLREIRARSADRATSPR